MDLVDHQVAAVLSNANTLVRSVKFANLLHHLAVYQ